MEVFINGMSTVSPQETFTGAGLLKNPAEYREVRYLKCIEPQYSEYIDPLAARRMSRIIKIGVCTALKCLSDAGIKNPDAIVTGTGMGCLEDTEKFLGSVYENEEKLLNPTPFIQSTHNTIASTIALLLKCNNYNNTYGHRGFSFENALLDGMMLMREDAAHNVLVGSADELTPGFFKITDRLGLWKKETVSNFDLINCKSSGSLPGEGSAFFLISNRKNEKTIARVKSVVTFFKPENITETERKLSDFVIRNMTDAGTLDLIILGINGDKESDDIYNSLRTSIFNHVPAAFYKHLCGEYYTSAAFATSLAAGIVREQNVPDIMRIGNGHGAGINNILIYNHVRNVNHSAILISSC